jgi:glycosyltransferase involved in cell wall biosynthesis
MMHNRADLRPALRIAALIRRHGIDLVHTHGTRAGFYGGLGCRLAGMRRTIYTVHGFSFNQDIHPVGREAFFRVEKLLGRWNRALISVSEHDRRIAVARGVCPPERIRTIHNGIDLARFDPTAGNGEVRKGLAIPDRAPVVGVISRLVPQKGLEYFLEAARKISDQRGDAVFLVVGEGELEETLRRRAADLGLADRVRFLGARHDVAEYYRSFDVFVLSSLWEGQPIALIEALAMRRPTVATVTSGSPEVVQDGRTGLLVPPKDPGALAAAVLWFLDHPDEAGEMARRGRTFVEEHFTEERMIARTLDVYRELLAEEA